MIIVLKVESEILYELYYLTPTCGLLNPSRVTPLVDHKQENILKNTKMVK